MENIDYRDFPDSDKCGECGHKLALLTKENGQKRICAIHELINEVRCNVVRAECSHCDTVFVQKTEDGELVAGETH